MSDKESEDPGPQAPDQTAIEKAINTFNEKQALEQSLISRIETLTAKIKEIAAKAKKNTPDSEKKEVKEEPPAPPSPVPEPGAPGHQVLPLLFGIAFVLIKVMNQQNLNRQSIYNMNNYFEYITTIIQVYQKLCNTAVTKGYTLKTDLLINALKSFYAYFYMAVSEKMQTLLSSPIYPPDTLDWIGTLKPEEDKKFASVEFTNVLDDLFKDIYPAFVYMVEDYQLTDPVTIKSMKGTMDTLEKTNAAEQPAVSAVAEGKQVKGGGDDEKEEAPPAEENKAFPKSPIPDTKCALGEPCERDPGELKEVANDQTEQLNTVLAKGLTTVNGGIDAIVKEIGDLSLSAKDIHISMVAHSQPPAAGSPQGITEILKELKKIKEALLKRIPDWIKSFDVVSTIQTDKMNPTQLEGIIEMGKTTKDMLQRIETLLKAESVFDQIVVNIETLSNQKGFKPDIIPIPKFQNLLTSMKKLLELLQKPAADRTTRVEISNIEKQLIVAIDEINKGLPTILKMEQPSVRIVEAPPAAPLPVTAVTPITPVTPVAAPSPPNEGAANPSTEGEIPSKVGGKRVLRRSRKATKSKAKKTLRRSR